MDNRNIIHACFDNNSLNSTNSFTHLLDEDSNEVTSITLSEYIDVDTFSQQLLAANSNLSIISLNIQTINTKFDEFKIIIDEINKHHPLSVICLQETHLKSNSETNVFEIEDYHLISKGRYCSNAGGLIIYVHKDFDYKIIELNNQPNVNIINQDNAENVQEKPLWESLFIEIKRKAKNSKTHIIGNVYRRPIDIVAGCNSFTEQFTELLSILQRKRRSIYISGDFNIDLFQINAKRHYNHYFDSIISSGFYPKISLPTRIDRYYGSTTLIDNIFTNSIDNHSSGVFTNEISDHQMIYTYSNESIKGESAINLSKSIHVMTKISISS